MRRRFDLYDVVLQLIAELRTIVEQLRHRDPDQARQLKKAANSILSNVGEGSRRQGRDRLHLWNIAAGSAAEGGVQIHASCPWGDLCLSVGRVSSAGAYPIGRFPDAAFLSGSIQVCS